MGGQPEEVTNDTTHQHIYQLIDSVTSGGEAMKSCEVLYVHSNQGCHVLLKEVGRTWSLATANIKVQHHRKWVKVSGLLWSTSHSQTLELLYRTAS